MICLEGGLAVYLSRLASQQGMKRSNDGTGRNAFCNGRTSTLPISDTSPTVGTHDLFQPDYPSTPRANQAHKDNVFSFAKTPSSGYLDSSMVVRSLSAPDVRMCCGNKRAPSEADEPMAKRPATDDSFLGSLHVAAPRQRIASS